MGRADYRNVNNCIWSLPVVSNMRQNIMAEALKSFSRVPIAAIKLTPDRKSAALNDTEIVLFHVKVGHIN